MTILEFLFLKEASREFTSYNSHKNETDLMMTVMSGHTDPTKQRDVAVTRVLCTYGIRWEAWSDPQLIMDGGDQKRVYISSCKPPSSVCPVIAADVRHILKFKDL
jgi:hypothetical protein